MLFFSNVLLSKLDYEKTDTTNASDSSQRGFDPLKRCDFGRAFNPPSGEQSFRNRTFTPNCS